ncbi:ArnT family glycosyltransferase [Phaeocystidibacter luteus]|uniref:Glycosyltransferase family 39 protein n=1 Tax=Phaeocystidibacter luteus TaxID=911197 RepID=A0A6N6RKQ5_9FLAO|nr:glycosyltransferase family 39 protein [Phaeocystidibacter luteus]KAB2808603.1 glycosyltransferase family 39 protein [Phaeocystidibacter luteus]
MNRRIESLIIILLLLPTIWMYVPAGHDWGGDFAQYILQAQDLLQGTNRATELYLYNADYYRLAPPSYPNGLPLVLAGWIALFGDGIQGMIVLMTLISVLFGLGVFRLLRQNFNFWISLAALFLTMYNPWMIRFKAEVIADLPFATLIVWTLLVYQRSLNGKLWAHILTPLLVGLTIMTKAHGIILLAAFALDGFSHFRQRETRKQGIRSLSNVILGSGITAIGVALFSAPGGIQLGHFSSITADHGGYGSAFFSNLIGYFNIYVAYFIRDVGSLTWVAEVVGHIMAYSAILGLVLRWVRKQFGILDWVFLGLMAALLLFPITNGFRYLLPAYPALLIYSLSGLSAIPWHKLKRPWLAPALGMALAAFIFFKGWGKIAELPAIPEGPYLAKYDSLHESLKAHTDDLTILVTEKPRVFGLFHGLHAGSVAPSQSDIHSGIKNLVESFEERNDGEVRGIWVLDIHFISHPSIDHYVQDGDKSMGERIDGDGWTLRKYGR